MASAHLFFCKPITPGTPTSFIHGCRTLIADQNQQGAPMWDALSVAIASSGGDVISALAMFNELKGIKATIATHNAGAVDSSAILPFIAGAQRTACAASAFFFHQVHWSFSSPGPLTMGSITDSTVWLSRYEGMMAEAVAGRTSLKKDEVLRLMRAGTSMCPDEAKKCGLIHDIEELSTPLGARTWQA